MTEAAATQSSGSELNRSVSALLLAQFLTAFGDNAVMFAVIAIVLQGDQAAAWYVPALQASFLLAFVLLAPWVGPFADSRSKRDVLILGNLIKALGTGMILLGIEPLLAYGLVGLGAAVYSPAKYGILPELVSNRFLVKANSWVEASTIAAIILGTLVGGKLADRSIDIALWLIIGLYGVSILASFFIRHLPPQGGEFSGALAGFTRMTRDFLHTPRARFSILGGSLFWGTSAVMRVLLVAWAPLVLGTRLAGDISELALALALGVITGAALVPKLIPLEHLRRARLPAYGMGLLIVAFGFVGGEWTAWLVLFLLGIAGGMLVVPINAALQEIGHATIGSGRAVAIQNFFQNLAMLLTVNLYMLAAAFKLQPVPAILALGALVLATTLLISRNVPEGDPYRAPGENRP